MAVENIWGGGYSSRGLVVVFAFGLIHGMGFASAFGKLTILQGSMLGALAGFNLGVEGGQLAVIAAALALTGWVRNDAIFRRWVAVPGSVLIGTVGVYWAMERLLN